jgi:hypothetical protein
MLQELPLPLAAEQQLLHYLEAPEQSSNCYTTYKQQSRAEMLPHLQY